MKKNEVKPITENYPHRIIIDEDDYQFLRYVLSKDHHIQYNYNVREGEVTNYILALARQRISEIEYLDLVNSMPEDDDPLYYI